jgi:hypothetical protein
MKDFDSLIDIWNDQKTQPVVDYKEVISHYKTDRQHLSLKLLIEILIMQAALALLSYTYIYSDFQFWTTNLGFAIIAVCFIYFIVMQIRNIRSIAKSNTLFDLPQDHIRFIQAFRKTRHTQHTRDFKIYIFSLSFGLSLCLIEFFYRLNLAVILSLTALTLAWFAFCYFYLMKIYIKKEALKFEEMLNDLERLDSQFKDVE